jgi:hypothetical protein
VHPVNLLDLLVVLGLLHVHIPAHDHQVHQVAQPLVLSIPASRAVEITTLDFHTLLRDMLGSIEQGVHRSSLSTIDRPTRCRTRLLLPYQLVEPSTDYNGCFNSDERLGRPVPPSGKVYAFIFVYVLLKPGRTACINFLLMLLTFKALKLLADGGSRSGYLRP